MTELKPDCYVCSETGEAFGVGHDPKKPHNCLGVDCSGKLTAHYSAENLIQWLEDEKKPNEEKAYNTEKYPMGHYDSEIRITLIDSFISTLKGAS